MIKFSDFLIKYTINFKLKSIIYVKNFYKKMKLK